MIQTQHNPASVYTDVNALQGIRRLGKEDKNAALMEVAKQFESMFLNMMLSSMRAANQVFKEDSLFHSSESDFYQKMYDDQISLSLSSSQGTGLAEVIHHQLLNNYGDQQHNPELDHTRLRRHNSSLKDTLINVDQALKKLSDQKLASSPEKNKGNDLAQGDGYKAVQFSSPEEFVAQLYPHAQRLSQQLKVDARVIVAQAALETGWGKHMITDQQGRNSFNLFGIKAGKDWQGQSVDVQTHEYRDGVAVKEKAAFRSYASLQEGLEDYARFLQGSQRYHSALGQQLGGKDYGYRLQQAGYATDPAYGQKIERISSSELLNQAFNRFLPKKVEATEITANE